MRRNGKRWRLPAWGAALGVVLAACSQGSTPRPGELGNCTPMGDAGCNPKLGGGGGSGPGDGGGAPGDAQAAEAGGQCGAAESELVVQNTTCLPCLEASACCQGSVACSSLPDCLSLLRCMEACSISDATCINACENQWPNGITAYTDLANCLSQSCNPQCPALPQALANDF